MINSGRRLVVAFAAIALLLSMIISTEATTAAGSVTFVQGTAFDNSSGGTSLTVALSQPVGAGDLLVGWFAQYGSTGQVNVSDSVNGAWTRDPQATQFGGTSGDIALYYLVGSKAAAGGVTITVSAATGADFQGAVAEYAGVAAAAAFSAMAVSRGSTTAVNSGATASAAAGDLVYAAEVTGVSPGAVPTSGSSDGVGFTERESTTQGSAFEEDITAGAAGAQTGTATLAKATDWYAVVATFQPATGSSAQPPTVPTGLATTTVTSSSVGLSWNAATDSTGTLAGYTVYRNGNVVATTGAGTSTYTDSTVAPSTNYQYTVDAFDTSGNHSAQSQPALSVTTPSGSSQQAVKWVQGASVSTGTQVTSTTLQLVNPVSSGDLLVGWFGQYGSSGQVKVSDNINGAWTRTGATTTFSNGGGDLAMYYVQNTGAASGLTITISATTATYLQGAASEFSGIAKTGALDQVAAAKANSASVDSGPTAAVGAGELVVGGIVTGGQPGTVTAGSSQSQPFTMGTETTSGTADLEYVLSSATGTQDARATFSSATDWYAGVAVFHPATGSSAQPPTVPTGLATTTLTSSSVGLSWSASTDATGTLAGYTVYRNGNEVGTTGAGTTTYTDSTVSPSTTYQYTVDAFDAAGTHSAQSQPALSVTTPAAANGNGTGTMTVLPTSVTAGSTTNQLGFTFTAPSSPFGAGSEVALTVPTGWTAPTTTNTTTTAGTCTPGTLALSGSGPSTITVPQTCAAGTSFTINYGVSGHQITAPTAAGSVTFTAASSQGSLGTLTNLTSGSPSVTVTAQTTGDTLSLAAGNTQSTTVGTAFGTNLEVQDLDQYGNPVPNVTVTFTAPSSGASGTFANSTVTTTATTNSSGDATASTFTANTTAGSYSVTTAASGVVSPLSFSETNTAAAASSIKWVQGASVSTGTQVTSTTLQLVNPVSSGDLLVGWFGQYGSSGQVKVSDNINGAWTRTGATTTFSNGGGDLAMYYVQNTGAASGLTITISATTATYLQGAASEFSGIAKTGALDQVAAAKANSASVDSGPTAAVGAGELVVGGIVTGGQPGTVTAWLLPEPAVHDGHRDDLGDRRPRVRLEQRHGHPGRQGHVQLGHRLVRGRRGLPPGDGLQRPAANGPDRTGDHDLDVELGRAQLERVDRRHGHPGRLHGVSQRQ